MPVYEYLCRDCGESFEIKQSFKDNPLTVCPNCAGHIHRVPQAAGVVFKGSGWYITDSKGKQNLATAGEKKAGTEAASANTSGGEAEKPSTAAPAPAKPAPAPGTSASPSVSTGA